MSRFEDKNLPAFPVTEEETDRLEEGIDIYYGLTKREYFAAKALQGLMVQSIAGNHNNGTKGFNQDRAKFAVNMADALLEALSE